MRSERTYVRCYISISRRFEPVESVAAGRRKDDLILQIREIEHGRVGHNRPIRRGQVRILLQHEIHRGNDPGKDEVVARRVQVHLGRRCGLTSPDSARFDGRRDKLVPVG